MNKQRLTLIVCSLILAASCGILLKKVITPEDDASMIRRMFTDLERVAEKSRAESVIVLAERVKSTGKYFSDPCRFDIAGVPNGKGLMNRQQLESNVMVLRRFFDSLAFHFSDFYLEFNPEKTSCMVFFSVSFHGKAKGESASLVRDLKAKLDKIDGKWKIVSIAIRDVIKK